MTLSNVGDKITISQKNSDKSPKTFETFIIKP